MTYCTNNNKRRTRHVRLKTMHRALPPGYVFVFILGRVCRRGILTGEYQAASVF